MVQKQTTCDWADLPVIMAVARAGTLRAAARALGVSHSTVLRRLEAAEAALGTALFTRRPDGRHDLTPSGQDAFDTAEQLEELVGGMERRIGGRDLELAGPLHVTMPATMLPSLWPDLAAFADRYPRIELAVSGGFGIADLAHREADVALRIIGEPAPELVGRKLATVAVGIYGSNAYLATLRPRARLDEHAFIGWSLPNMVFARWIAGNVPAAQIRCRVSSDAQLEAAVSAGVGVSLMPCMLGDSHADWRRVRLVDEIAAPLWILTHRDLRATVRMRAFRDYLAEAVLARRALIEGRRPVARAPRGTGPGHGTRPGRGTGPGHNTRPG
jgi:DNA-binding transcriptional LysR family regulator